MKVYIAGPMRNRPLWNFPAFDRAEIILHRDHGFDVFSPAARDRAEGFDPLVPICMDDDFLRKAMAADLAFITKKADMVVVLDGWEDSKGACAEVATAVAIGIPVMPFAEFIQGPTAIPHNIDLSISTEAVNTEVRVTDPNTGGQKGDKLARFDLIPSEALWQVAELYGAGARKYADRNWERGYAWHLSYAALLRHANLFWMGEDYDPETLCHHLASVVFHAFALMTFRTTHPGLDDRPPAYGEDVIES